jgi:hypothetical protein
MRTYSGIPEKRPSRGVMKAGALVAMTMACMSAHATLGGDSNSVNADRSALGATVATHAVKNYVDNILTLPDGSVVHELVNASGKVFEVTWNSRGHRPDMDQLLGSYVSRFEGTGKHHHNPTAHHAKRVDADLVIVSNRVHRQFSGVAYLPALLPDNTTGPVSVSSEVTK